MKFVTPTRPSEFSVSYDLTTEILTAVVIVGLLVLAAVVHIILVGVLMILTPILGLVYSPRRYVILGRTLTVKRLIGNVEVPLEGVHAQLIAPALRRTAMRSGAPYCQSAVTSQTGI
jgi:hypothetical protein